MAEKSPTEVKVTTIKRVILQNLMTDVEGNSRTLRKALRILDILEFTPEEREAINLQQTPAGGLTWDNPDKEWVLTFRDGNDLAFLRATFKNHTWKGIHPRLVMELEEALGITYPEDEEV